MMLRTAVSLLGLLVSGCAGLNISSLSLGTAGSAHKKDGAIPGYIIYQPMVVMEIGEKEVCIKKDKDKCVESEFRCAAGAPFLLPDYGKPYVIEIRSGFGKAGVEVEIVDGWRLGKAKDASDNTAVLGFVQKFLEAGKILAFDSTKETKPACKAAGLYRVTIEGDSVELKQLKIY